MCRAHICNADTTTSKWTTPSKACGVVSFALGTIVLTLEIQIAAWQSVRRWPCAYREHTPFGVDWACRYKVFERAATTCSADIRWHWRYWISSSLNVRDFQWFSRLFFFCIAKWDEVLIFNYLFRYSKTSLLLAHNDMAVKHVRDILHIGRPRALLDRCVCGFLHYVQTVSILSHVGQQSGNFLALLLPKHQFY